MNLKPVVTCEYASVFTIHPATILSEGCINNPSLPQIPVTFRFSNRWSREFSQRFP